MSIFVIGMNHTTAPLALREQIYFAKDKLPFYLQDLLNRGLAREAVLLSTCNRSELYAEADDGCELSDWFSKASKEVKAALYVYQDQEAVSHIMQVACGLDSMVLGEVQILGQMKEAFSESCAAGAVDTLFHHLFQQVFSVAKEIRTATSIGACPVSVASAAFHFVKSQHLDFLQQHIALIGTGEMAHLLMRYLKPHTQLLMIVGRNKEKASVLVQESNGVFYELDEMNHVLVNADVVFSATGSATPLITKTMMTDVMKARGARPMTLIDLAVPRDIEAAITNLSNVNLYCIDDLKVIIEKNRQGREHAAEKAKEMIRDKCHAFFTEFNTRDNVTHAICAYRGQIEELCALELQKAKQQLQSGHDPEIVLDAFAYALTQKLLHAPSVQLRQAGREGRFDLLQFAKQLFAIPG